MSRTTKLTSLTTWKVPKATLKQPNQPIWPCEKFPEPLNTFAAHLARSQKQLRTCDWSSLTTWKCHKPLWNYQTNQSGLVKSFQNQSSNWFDHLKRVPHSTMMAKMFSLNIWKVSKLKTNKQITKKSPKQVTNHQTKKCPKLIKIDNRKVLKTTSPTDLATLKVSKTAEKLAWAPKKPN